MEINEYTGTPDENLNLRDTELRTLREGGHDVEGPVIFTIENNEHEFGNMWTRIVAWRIDKPFGGYILEWGDAKAGYWNELLPDLKAAEERKRFILQQYSLSVYGKGITPLKEWLYDHMHYRTEKWISIQPMPIDGDTQSPHI